MDNKENYIDTLQPVINDSFVESVTKMASLTSQYYDFINQNTSSFQNIAESINIVNQNIVSKIDFTGLTSAIEPFVIMNASPILEACDVSKSFQNLNLDLFTGYGEIINSLDALSVNIIEQALEGTDFSTEEVLADINDLKEAFSVSEKDTDSILLENQWKLFLKKHPSLANVIFVMGTLIGLVSGIFAINELGELVVSETQEVVVKMQGNEDTFFIKVDSAKLYTEPDSHSEVITNILYAEEVTRIESIKLWDKVTYINPEGEGVTGWIAKRNIIPYKDYQFNSDDLYDLE